VVVLIIIIILLILIILIIIIIKYGHGRIQEFAKGGGGPSRSIPLLFFPSFPLLLRSRAS